MDNKIRFLLLLFFIWRCFLQVLAIQAPSILPYKPTFVAPEILPLYTKYSSVYSWANFDGVHYVTIAEHSYDVADLIQAFFPLYPILIHIFSFFSLNTLYAGLLISNLSFVSVLFVWYFFFSRFFSQKQVLLSIIALILFPTSFFFVSLYGESLFLLLVLLTFAFAGKNKWGLASMCAFFATATRITGIFLVLALLIEFVLTNTTKIKNGYQSLLLFVRQNAGTLIKIFAATLGLGAYMLYLWIHFHDPFYFYTVQSRFGGGREQGFILLPQVIWRYIKILFTANPQTFSYFAAVQELFYTLFGIFCLSFAIIKKYRIKFSWLFFSMSSIILPTFTGTFSSMPRYILMIFPIFLLLGYIFSKKKMFFLLYTIISTSLLIINTILYIQGYWVA